jgi:hypothetical protein
MVYNNRMFIIYVIVISFSTFALEAFDKLTDVKLLRVLPENIIVMNRGLEDGIIRNDHVKLSNEITGFSSRAICIKVTSDLSYWKIYRIPKSEAFSLDYTYTMTGIPDREIPQAQAEWRYKEIEIRDTEKKNENLTVQDPFNIRPDLPEKITEKDIITSDLKERKDLFIEKNLDKYQFQRDLNHFHFSLFASPFMKQSINQGESLRYGLKGSNSGTKYRLSTQFEQQQTKLTDPTTKKSVATSSTFGQAQFIIRNLNQSTSSLSLINYTSQKFSQLGTPASHWQFGMIGFTWHLHQTKSWEYIDFSYIPLYDWRRTEFILNNKISSIDRSGLRHGFRLGIKTMINERVALENMLWVRPFQDLTNWKIESDNLNLINDLKLIFNLTSYLFFDYNIIYQKDKLWKTQSGLPDSNIINSINLRYDFNL